MVIKNELDEIKTILGYNTESLIPNFNMPTKVEMVRSLWTPGSYHQALSRIKRPKKRSKVEQKRYDMRKAQKLARKQTRKANK